MTHGYQIIFAVGHGGVLGAVLEPQTANLLSDQDRKRSWEVRIGCIRPDGPIRESAFDEVVDDLSEFCAFHGISLPRAPSRD